MAAPIHGIGSSSALLPQTDARPSPSPIGSPISAPKPIGTPSVTGGSGSGDSSSDFGKTLSNALGDAGKAERAADDAANRFAAGDPQMGIHEVMIAAEKANISVRYAVTLKNKLLEAYRELMNTPL